VEVTYFGKGGEVLSARTPPIPVTITSLIANEPEPKLKENAGPVPVIQRDYLYAYIAGGLAAAGLGAALALFIRRVCARARRTGRRRRRGRRTRWRWNASTAWAPGWREATTCGPSPSSCRKSCPGFYREVMRQLGTAGWGESKPLAAPEAIAAFWRGAQLAEPSREESLKRAFLLAATPNHQAREPWMPQLAGLLVHAALPRFGAEVSLDNVMVARGSAWLALTERACAQELPDLWVPPLFLAGREQAAAAVWNRAGTNRPVPGHGPSPPGTYG